MRIYWKRRVKRAMTHQQIRKQLPDYALGLLTPIQANEVMEHLSSCAACCQLVHREREIGELVRTTINAATRPDPARLSQLMPPPPHSGQWGIGTNLTGRLAPALVMLAIIVSVILFYSPESQRPFPAFVPVTATATTTNTPTATITQRAVDQFQTVPTAALPASHEKAVDLISALPTPYLSPTPVAANNFLTDY